MIKAISTAAPVFILGNIGSGTTILHKVLLAAIDGAADIDPSDVESRPFWMRHGIRFGTVLTGTFCPSTGADAVPEESKTRIRRAFHKASSPGSRVITKNVHFCNKLPLLHELFPSALYIHIVRQDLSVVANLKKKFTRLYESDTLWRTSCVHYWPDEDRPCWSVLSRERPTRRRIVSENLRRLIRRRGLIQTPAFADWTAFQKEHPDGSRYFPGGGFQRLEEAWIKTNYNVLLDVESLDLGSRYCAINYQSLVEQPAETFGSLEAFMGVTYRNGFAFERLRADRQDKWRSELTAGEVEQCKNQRQKFQFEVSTLSNRLPSPLIAE